jgi:hypothetical protein
MSNGIDLASADIAAENIGSPALRRLFPSRHPSQRRIDLEQDIGEQA